MSEELDEVIAGLNLDQRWLLLELPADGSERTWMNGLPVNRLPGLRGFGQSEFIVSFHDRKGSHIALSNFGKAVRQAIKDTSNHG